MGLTTHIEMGHQITPSIQRLLCQIACLCTLQLDVLITHFPLIFGQFIWTVLYGYKTASLKYSLIYLILRYAQVQGLIQCQKLWVTFMFGVVRRVFCNQICIILEWKFLSDTPGSKNELIWASEIFAQHKFDWF